MAPKQPNLLFIMSDDHAAHAISAYGSRINETPHLDRIAEGGMRFDAAFCTNSICAPSRAAILTGTYNHVNEVTTLATHLDNSLWTFPKALQAAGYQTSMFGKWHLGHGDAHDPTGFDHWRVLPGQGHYHNPVFIDSEKGIVERGGYVTDLITNDCLRRLDRRDPDRPFALFCHHKAPHRTWEPDARHFTMYDDVEIPYPDTFRDTLEGRAEVVQAVKMRMLDLDPIVDLKATVPPGLTLDEEIDWRYQRYIKDYLRVVASIDDNVGRMLDYLDDNDLADDTIVVYTSDQGFFLGDHGWFDKRLMYEESLAMPLLVRYPAAVAPAQVCDDIVVNVDFGPTLLDLCGVEPADHVQGRSFAPLLRGESPDDWPESMYYRYWMHNDGAHAVPAHYGVRTRTHKLICYYNDPLDQPGARGPANPVEWELFDLVADPLEVDNIHGAPGTEAITAELMAELERLQAEVGDQPFTPAD
ncbi:sulfatase family protein [Ilumatobacter coccineus]|uniref:Putative sulfatase n=1 Tax=Ilumatobacter coccineus (strain NBRC 103263 / KCTC 29153 / YM16-304) TaxID=1313172 RepID=A0A6C7EI37_ILUCY|nr:sulfatase [Ilumatobacter coccineus]BAN04208.1 putative sulfatase [Ilumatobacter coccineus YM16-304]